MSASPRASVVGLDVRLLRRSTASFIALLVLYAIGVTAGYTAAYPSVESRRTLAGLLDNPGFRAMFGVGHRLDTVGGFAAWRFGGIAVVLVAIWALLASTRLTRGEEDAGRLELVAAGALTRTEILAGAVVTLAAAVIVMTAVVTASLAVSGAPLGGSALLAAAVCGGGVVYGAVGLLAAQLMGTRRAAATAAGLALGGSFLLRAGADASTNLGWVRWLTPLGWAEEVRPYDQPEAAAFVPGLVLACTLTLVSLGVARRRDHGEAVFATRSSRAPRHALLSSSAAFSARLLAPRAISWLVPVAAVGLFFGLLSKEVARVLATAHGVNDALARIGIDPSLPMRAFFGLILIVVMLLVVVFVAVQVAAFREEEATGRLDNVLAGSVGRRRWLAAQAGLISLSATVIAFIAAGALAAGASIQRSGVALTGFAGAGVNLVPCILLFVGIGVLLFAVAPRLAGPALYALIVASFLVETVGSVVNAPSWLLNTSPFRHVAPVPAVAANTGAAVALIVVGVSAAAAGVAAFGRRDLVGA